MNNKKIIIIVVSVVMVLFLLMIAVIGTSFSVYKYNKKTIQTEYQQIQKTNKLLP